MTPAHVIGLLSFALNYAVTCYGYVNILNPRWGKVKTWILSVTIVVLALICVRDAIFVPIQRMVTMVPLVFVLVIVFYTDRIGVKVAIFAVMCFVEFVCDALSWLFVGLTFPEHDREALEEIGYTQEFVFPRLFYASLLFVFVSLLIAVWKRHQSNPMRRGDQSLVVFASLQVLAQAVFLSLVLNAVETTINPAYYAMLLSFDIGGLLSLGLFLSIFRHQSLLEARMQAVEAQRRMRDRYAHSLALYSGAVAKLRAELARSVDELAAKIGSATPEQWHAWQTGESRLESFSFSHQYSNRVAVNALMHEKERVAQAKGIELECRTILDVPQLSEFALCTVLANMLDNAIEAASNVKGKRWITLNCMVKSGQRSLLCSNATAPEFMKGKAETSEHGLGLAIIRTTVEERGGNVYVRSTPNSFATLVVFPSQTRQNAKRQVERGPDETAKAASATK